MAAPHLAVIDGEEAPDANDQYLMLQAILGAWPIELLDDATDNEAVNSFRERLEGYVTKALREAKRHTSWVHGNEPYEAAALALLRGLLSPDSTFLSEFRPLASRLASIGMLVSLARTALKCSIPGVPDFYQGTELWDLSLVDPDNRRPVDYDRRAEMLGHNEEPQALIAAWRDGRIKQRLVRSILDDRASAPTLYASGDYQPLKAGGGKDRNVLAFLRTCGSERLAVVVPRLFAGLVEDGEAPSASIWEGTRIPLPQGRWRDIVTGREFAADGRGHPVAELFTDLPISVLRAQS